MKKKMLYLILAFVPLLYAQNMEKIFSFPVENPLYFMERDIYPADNDPNPYFVQGPRSFEIKGDILAITLNPTFEEMSHWIYERPKEHENDTEMKRIYESYEKYPYKTIYFLRNENGTYSRCIKPDDFEPEKAHVNIRQRSRKIFVHGNSVLGKGNEIPVRAVNERKYYNTSSKYIGEDSNHFLYFCTYDRNEYKLPNYFADIEFYAVNPENGKMYCALMPSSQYYIFAKIWVTSNRIYEGENSWLYYEADIYSLDPDSGDIYMMNLSEDNTSWELFRMKNVWTPLIEEIKETPAVPVEIKEAEVVPAENRKAVKKERKKGKKEKKGL